MYQTVSYNLKTLSLSLMMFLLINLNAASGGRTTVLFEQKSDCARKGVLMSDKTMVAGVLMSFNRFSRENSLSCLTALNNQMTV